MATHSTSTRDPLNKYLKNALSEIKGALSIKIKGCERIETIYGSKTSSYLVNTTPLKNKSHTKKFFLKIGTKEHITRELKGYFFIKEYLPSPKIILSSRSKKSPYQFILFEYVSGKLMAEKFLEDEKAKNIKSFSAIEKRKEKMLSKLFSGPEIKIDFNIYKKSPANLLFFKRIYGSRYRDYYQKNEKNISRYFNKKIVLNDKEFPLTINEIIGNIKKKYHQSSRKVAGIRGHGDAHHGNIIVNKKIWFIDNEYAGISTPFMELAKPYYNDFLGTLFFHHHKKLQKLFKISHITETKYKLSLNIVCNHKIKNFVNITKIKLNQRKNTAHKNTDDYLSLNDYLVICHLLTKNPNNYPNETQLLFIIFTIALASFDPFKPESIYTFFRR